MMPNFSLTGAEVLTKDGLSLGDLHVSDGLIDETSSGKVIDLTGYLILPGIIDVHGDGFERHLAPRRGAMLDLKRGLFAAESELAANGITTATLAQFYSWEGGMRGPDFATRMFAALNDIRPDVATDMRPQLRFETHLLEKYDTILDLIDTQNIGYVVFNDHIPHTRLAAGKRPPRLTGQALKSGRSPEAHLAMLHALHADGALVPDALEKICKILIARGIIIGSHDDHTAADVAIWHKRGAQICEFPETWEAAQSTTGFVVMGAPNVMRGGSHKDNVDAVDLVSAGLCTALASDYHYPSLLQAAFHLAETGIVTFPAAWALISSGPALVLGLTDRGEIAKGKRADLVILDQKTKRLGATISGGKVSYMTGAVATQFMG